MNNKTRAYITAALILVGVVIANIVGYLSATAETGAVTDRFFEENYLIPADFIFATIWPFIYLNLAAFAIFQALPSQTDNPRFQKAGFVLGVNLLFNGAWVVIYGMTWFVWSLVIIAALLASAFYVHRVLEIGVAPASGFERWLRIPISIYTGWLTVATILNVTAVLMILGWEGGPLSPVTWAVIMLIVAGALGVVVRTLLNDWAYMIPFTYAFFGIAVKYTDIVPLAGTAAALAVLYLIVLVIGAFNTRTQQVSRRALSA